MSNPNPHQTIGYFGMENWRKVLNINSKILNCPCRGNKPDYKKTQSLLYHFEKNHPEHYDEMKREVRQKRTLSHETRQQTSIILQDDTTSSYQKDCSSTSEIRFIYEYPGSSFENVEVDEEIIDRK